MALYLLHRAIGFPFFSGGDSGVEFLKLSSVTGGYLFGFVLAAAAVGWLSEWGWDRSVATTASASWSPQSPNWNRTSSRDSYDVLPREELWLLWFKVVSGVAC